MSDKAAMVKDADQAFAELHRAIDGLTDDELQHAWLGTWGVREILIHVSGWHDEMVKAPRTGQRSIRASSVRPLMPCGCAPRRPG